MPWSMRLGKAFFLYADELGNMSRFSASSG